MKIVILAGGFGTRLTEETELRTKPLVEIGGKPILWHVMKIFEAGGYNDFIICCGYKGQLIKSYFVNYSPRTTTGHPIAVEFWPAEREMEGDAGRHRPRHTHRRSHQAGRALCQSRLVRPTATASRGSIAEVVRSTASMGAATVTACRRAAVCVSTRCQRQRKASTKSRTTRSVGSTADFSCASRRFSTILRTTPPVGSVLRWKDWRARAN